MLFKKAIVLPKHYGLFTFGALWAASWIFSSVLSIAPVESLWGTYEQMQGTVINIFYALHFLISLYILSLSENRAVFVNAFLNTAVAIGLILSVHAILQRLGFDPLLGAPNAFPGRSFSLMGSPNGLGELLVIPAAAAVVRLVDEWSKNPLFRNKRVIKLWLAAAIVLLLGMGTTLNRASIVGLTIALGAVLAYDSITRQQHHFTSLFRRALPWGVLGIVLLAVATFTLYDLRSLSTRAVLWSQSLPLVAEYPLTGSGPATYYQTFQTVQTKDIFLSERMTDIAQNPHNQLIQILLERGAFGLAVALIPLIFLAWVFFTKRLETLNAKISFVGIAGVTIAVQLGFLLSTHTVFLIALWAVLIGETVEIRRNAFTVKLPVVALTVLLLLSTGLMAFAVGSSRVYGDTLLRRALGVYLSGNDVKATELFNQSFRYNRFYTYPYRTAFFFYKNKDAADLNNWNDAVGKITGRNFQYYLDGAELAMYRGNIPYAEELFAEAQKRAPHWPTLWESWGSLQYEKHAYAKAVFAYENLRALAPPYFEWKTDLNTRSFEDKEKYRIFSITHHSFYEAMRKLARSYEYVGRDENAEELEKFL